MFAFIKLFSSRGSSSSHNEGDVPSIANWRLWLASSSSAFSVCKASSFSMHSICFFVCFLYYFVPMCVIYACSFKAGFSFSAPANQEDCRKEEKKKWKEYLGLFYSIFIWLSSNINTTIFLWFLLFLLCSKCFFGLFALGTRSASINWTSKKRFSHSITRHQHFCPPIQFN